MRVSTTKEELLDKGLQIDHEQFEQLCKMVIERAEPTRELELTPFRGDGGIDIHAVIDRELFHARLGIQAKQYASGNTVGARTLRGFKGALSEQQYHIGTVITTSSFTSGAETSANQDFIRLIDGDRLTDIMIESSIGVVTDDESYELDPTFWSAFEKPERTDTIPSLEVPQADNFEVIRTVIQAVGVGSDTKPNIADYVRRQTDTDTFDPRQADYYGIAAWLLQFLHKEQEVEVDNHTIRRWGLTRLGEEYLTYLDRGNRESADDLLTQQIRDVEIISRVYAQLEVDGTLSRSDITEILAAETDLSDSTTRRRARTVGQWLVRLPEITTSGRGAQQQYVLASTPR
ncbi:restriction endonuclease [Halorubrum lipolyticum]|uniref:restriction endonuclease n=1 Tax=Halorubrum lipolyticum TaxID=368624 RepID=UPI000677EDE6|nr:restriction endonuclease [Halorubrum lipolyticum]